VDHPEITQAIERVRTACVEVGLPIGIFGLSAEAVQPYIARGFTMIVVGVDTVLMANAAAAALKAVRDV
jgi:2-keto-3-deoxy-L-rhamnonate aldolase RhmA